MEGVVERGLPKKEDGKLRIALLYPGSYKESAAALGYITVYSLLNNVEEVVAHRFTIDSPFSLETGHSIRSYDIILASIPYEPMLFKLWKALQEWKVKKPLILGGPGVWNPLPASRIADGVFIGDFEDSAKILAERLLESTNPEDWDNVPGLYVPKLENQVKFQRHDLSYRPPAYVPRESALGQYPLIVEVSRGCNFGCRFCLLGWTHRPRRDRKLSQILEWIGEGLENGAKKVYFYGSDILGHPHIKKVLELLAAFEIPFSLSSMRIDKLDQEMLSIFRAGGVRSLTLAPESFVERIQNFINKKITTEQIFDVAILARKAGFSHIKLYLMLFGVEGEEKELDANIRRISKVIRAKTSVNFFIPKPYTPLQYHPIPSLERMREESAYLRKKGYSVMHPVRAWIQAALSVGDEKAGELIIKGANNTAPARLLKLVRELGLDPNRRNFKWMEIVDTGVSEEYLRREYEKAMSGELTPPCHVRCSLCGICF